MKRPKPHIIFTLNTAVLSVVLVVGTACSPLPSHATPIDPRASTQISLVASLEVVTLAPLPPSATPESTQARATPLQGGEALLEQYCVPCHGADFFHQIEKSRAEWEIILQNMGAFGVKLDEFEKIVLLEYLSEGALP